MNRRRSVRDSQAWTGVEWGDMSTSTSTLDILIIAPHPDDAELGMAGAILKFKEEGRKVGVLDLTSGEPTPHGTLEIRAQETAAATEILGLDWRENLGLPNRSLEPSCNNDSMGRRACSASWIWRSCGWRSNSIGRACRHG